MLQVPYRFWIIKGAGVGYSSTHETLVVRPEIIVRNTICRQRWSWSSSNCIIPAIGQVIWRCTEICSLMLGTYLRIPVHLDEIPNPHTPTQPPEPTPVHYWTTSYLDTLIISGPLNGRFVLCHSITAVEETIFERKVFCVATTILGKTAPVKEHLQHNQLVCPGKKAFPKYNHAPISYVTLILPCLPI